MAVKYKILKGPLYVEGDIIFSGEIQHGQLTNADNTTKALGVVGGLLVNQAQLDNGYNSAMGGAVSGTVTPVAPTISSVVPYYDSIIVLCSVQVNLRWPKRYEWQVSNDNLNWYSLNSSGSDWKGALNAVTATNDSRVGHTNLPFAGTFSNPTGYLLYYRVRVVTVADVISSWSSASSGTISPIPGGKIAASAITAAKIQISAITESLIAANAIISSKIASSAVTAAKIAAGAVTTAKVAISAITASLVAANAITGPKINAQAITSPKINTSAIIASLVASGAITNAKLGTSAVTAAKIAAGAVTTAKVAISAIIASLIAANAITNVKIGSSAITAAKIAAGAVTTAKVFAGAITATTIAAGAITTSKISAGAITASLMAADSITANSLQVLSRESNSANLVAEWNFNDIPEYPDDLSAAHCVYKSNFLVSVDGWVPFDGLTLSYAAGELICSYVSGGYTRVYHAGDPSYKLLEVWFVYTPELMAAEIQYYNNYHYVDFEAKEIINGFIVCRTYAAASVNIYLLVNQPISYKIHRVYVGDGTTATPAIDNSGNGTNVTLSDIAPQDGGLRTFGRAESYGSSDITKIGAMGTNSFWIHGKINTLSQIGTSDRPLFINSATTNAAIILQVGSNGGSITVYDNTSHSAQRTFTVTLAVDDTYDIWIDRTTGYLRCYINNSALTAIALTSFGSITLTTLVISDPSYPANCIVSYPRIYNRAPTEAERKALQEVPTGMYPGMIKANHIVAGAITATKLAVGSVTATSIAAGAITALKLDAGAVTATAISAGAVTAGKLAANSVIASNITSSVIAAKDINITGDIRGGGRYNADGTIADGTKYGIYIGFDGQLTVAGISFEGKLGNNGFWSAGNIIGSALSVSGNNAGVIAVLNAKTVAFVEYTFAALGHFTWNGLAWVSDGYTNLGSGMHGLAALNETDVAHVTDGSGYHKLECRRWNGSGWDLVGTALATNANSNPAIASLNATDIAYVDTVDKSLILLRFDGFSWSQIGNGLALTGIGYPAMATLNSTDIVFIDTLLKRVKTYRFNGTDWSLIAYGSALFIVSAPSITALNGSNILLNSTDFVTSGMQIWQYRTAVSWNLSTTTIPGYGSIAALDSENVIFYDEYNSKLKTIHFDCSISAPWKYPYVL